MRVPDPVMDMRLFKTATFTVSNVVSWVIGAVGFGSLFLIPLYFENVLGKSPLDTGIVLIPMGFAAAVAVAITGRLYNRVGPRLLTMVGIALLGLGSIGFVTAGPNTDPWSLTPWLIMRGAGFGMAGVPIQNLALSVVSNVAMARASSLFNVTRQIFAAVGVAGLSSYLTNHANALVPTITTQARAGQGAAGACVLATPQQLPAISACLARLVTADALNETFFLVVLLTFATMLVCIFLGQDPALKAAAREPVEEEREALAVG